MVEVGEHYRPTGDASDSKGDPLTLDSNGEPVASGVYRVVGATDGVALLRVTDADGRRANTGELRHVAPAALSTDFERAEDPDVGFSPLAAVRNLLSGFYWSFRRFF